MNEKNIAAGRVPKAAKVKTRWQNYDTRSTSMQPRLTLAPDHLADLRKSGLTDETIRQARISSVRPCDINRRIGYDIPGLISAYQIPFPPFVDGYTRLRLFYEPGQERYVNGDKKPKYVQRKGAPNRLYIPVPLFDSGILDDPTRPLWITEGEKKALKATQDGLPCIAITGLWNWKIPRTDKLIPDFKPIAWRGRQTFLVPDSDWLDPKKNLRQAVNRLSWALEEIGAIVRIVLLGREVAA